eukprot:SM000010S04380  [mRNA]  locus=s10:1240998:1244014:+ [translate_table: standard]
MGILSQQDVEGGAAHAPCSLPCFGFEGFEKRLEVEFSPAPFLSNNNKAGLRALSRAAIDGFLAAAECTIVSQLSNDLMDSYVLSESSLFIYPHRVIVKTCGTTRLLQSIPLLLESAADLGMAAMRCKYTRGSFHFPEAQPYGGNFAEEVKVLEEHFGHLGSGGQSYVLGNTLQFPNWHVYEVSAEQAAGCKPLYTLEICMTKLDRKVASQFYQGAGYDSPAALTKASGIRDLLPLSDINDYCFEPCGYSMNSIEQASHSTIHITPEEAFSYASFETQGYDAENVQLGKLVKQVAETFKPDCFSVALHAAGLSSTTVKGASWAKAVPVPEPYVCDGTSRQDLPCGSAVVFHNFKLRKLVEAGQECVPLSLALPEPLSLKSLPQPTEPFGKARFDAIGSTLTDMDSYVRAVVKSTNSEDAFYVLDIGLLVRLYHQWQEALPRVQPFYAVKCNQDATLLAVLASLGSGFDVASKAEMAAVMAMGVQQGNIIYANPCKLPSHIEEAQDRGIRLTTFDSEDELYKLKKIYPEAHVVLRLRADDLNARCPLGTKYGANMDECQGLLAVAASLGLHVAGVAFHVGSGASDGRSYFDAIAATKDIFDMAESMGLPKMTILDIGGGFTSAGGHGASFENAAAAINEALEKFFPEDTGVKVIAEPGRYFAEAPITLAAQVFGRRMRGRSHARSAEYWINDGIYGSMNCLLYDHAELTVRPLQCAAVLSAAPAPPIKSTIFGPTCDGLDTVLRDVWLPQLECGDWLVFPRMGAYTKAAGSSFNGFNTADIRTMYVYSEEQGSDDEAAETCESDSEGTTDDDDDCRAGLSDDANPSDSSHAVGLSAYHAGSSSEEDDDAYDLP